MTKQRSSLLSLDEIKTSAARYASKAAWLRGDPAAYQAAKRRGLFDEVCGHMPPTPLKLSLEDLIAFAAPHQTRGDWQKADQSAYVCAYRRGVLDVVIRLEHGFAYLVAVVDWYSRRVLTWWLSNSLEAGAAGTAWKRRCVATASLRSSILTRGCSSRAMPSRGFC